MRRPVPKSRRDSCSCCRARRETASVLSRSRPTVAGRLPWPGLHLSGCRFAASSGPLLLFGWGKSIPPESAPPEHPGKGRWAPPVAPIVQPTVRLELGQLAASTGRHWPLADRSQPPGSRPEGTLLFVSKSSFCSPRFVSDSDAMLLLRDNSLHPPKFKSMQTQSSACKTASGPYGTWLERAPASDHSSTELRMIF